MTLPHPPSDRPGDQDGRGGRDRPIIFSAPMIKALLAGRKTQTRRVLKPQPNMLNGGHPLNNGRGAFSTEAGWKRYPFRVGDRLWVRETWQTGSGYAGPQVAYRATGDAHDIDAWDGEDEGAGPSFNYDRLPGLKWHTWLPDLLSGTEGSWRSPIHMPRAFSRLTLIVEAVKVERLADISDADARAEGFASFGPDIACPYQDGPTGDAADAFAAYWDSLHGKGAFAASPWVAALTFRAIPRNIDSLSPTPTGEDGAVPHLTTEQEP